MSVRRHKLSLHEYLEWEDQQPDRNEFYRGETFAMTGGRRSHGCVVTNLVRHLGNALDGTPCRAFSESMKVQIGDDAICYPDVFVTCDKADLRTDMIFTAPTVVIEVLSPSTQAHDRSLKFALYRRLASLKEYVLIDPDSRRVEAFWRNAEDQWMLQDMSDEAALRLPALSATIGLKDVFAGIDLDT